MSAMTVYISGRVKDAALYRSLSEKMIAFVRDEEPGTTTYEWHLGEDGTTFNIDGFDSTDSFLEHMQNVQEQGFLDQFMASLDIERVLVTGTPTEAADPVFEQFGAAVLDSVGAI